MYYCYWKLVIIFIYGLDLTITLHYRVSKTSEIWKKGFYLYKVILYHFLSVYLLELTILSNMKVNRYYYDSKLEIKVIWVLPMYCIHIKNVPVILYDNYYYFMYWQSWMRNHLVICYVVYFEITVFRLENDQICAI
jgi:hypothetical protein